MRLAKMGIFLIIPVLILASTGAARADLTFKIYEDNNSASAAIYSTTGTSLDLTAPNTGFALSTAAKDYTFTGITASAVTGSAQGELHLTGTVGTTSTGSALHTLTILVSDNSYVAGGPNYSMASSSSYTFNSPADPNSAFAFKSYATPGTGLFGMSVPSPGHTYGVPGVGLKSFSNDAFNEAATPFTAASGYTLTESFVYTSNASNETFQPTGATIVTPTAVPEPSSILLFAIGAGSAALVAARRRSRRISGSPDSQAEIDPIH